MKAHLLHFTPFLLLLLSACGNGSDPQGSIRVQVMNQAGEVYAVDSACTLDYDLYKTDHKGYLFDETLGRYSASIECGKLSGSISWEILLEGENPDRLTRIVDSFCSDRQTLVVDPLHPVVDLQDHLGMSTDTRCSNWLEHDAIRQVEIMNLSLVCTKEDSTCDPIKGRDFLHIQGINGQYAEGRPVHLSMKAVFDHMEEDEVRTVLVTLRQLNGLNQEIDVPVVVRNAP